MQEREGLEAVAALAAGVPCRPAGMSDDELLREAEQWEALGRLVDARRTAISGEIAWRSRPALGETGLARRHGERDGAELLAREVRIAVYEARRRIGLGLRTRPRLALDGEELPGRYPHVAEALAAGAIGVGAARVVVDALAVTARRADPERLAAAERALVDAAADLSPDLVLEQACAWQAMLDPDGAQPGEEAARRGRSFRIGAEGRDGLTRSVILTPTEGTALLKAVLDAHRRGVQWERQPADDCDEDTEWHEAAGDQRSRAQYDHDVLLAVLRAGLRTEQEETVTSGGGPVEVVVHVTAADLERQRGCGWADGVLGRVSIPSVRRLQCDGATRLLVIGADGEALYLGKRIRRFTRAQRRALAARDGGCAWPGCRAPVVWTEAHHIRWVRRDNGRTDIDNGVLLCSFHHHLIHSTDEWEIRVHEHAPHLVPKRWRGAPLRRHRMQQHRLRSGPPSGAPPGSG